MSWNSTSTVCPARKVPQLHILVHCRRHHHCRRRRRRRRRPSVVVVRWVVVRRRRDDGWCLVTTKKIRSSVDRSVGRSKPTERTTTFSLRIHLPQSDTVVPNCSCTVKYTKRLCDLYAVTKVPTMNQITDDRCAMERVLIHSVYRSLVGVVVSGS